MTEITHAQRCEACGEATYAWERYCHECGADRWEAGSA